MNDKEIKAIKDFKHILDNPDTKFWIGTNGIKNIDIVLKLIEKQKAEIEKKDKIIDLMAEKLKQLREASLDDCFIPRSYRDIDDCLRTTCEECIKEYFENKVKESK